ncbi:hypothetical protein [Actinomadura flavalba]|uniref:hypothetical protein n=1 Tax=Actinomadura flavalba TaxID=1120938 RepID=UPI0012DEE0A4|nr:hypothetical protein [Actinomadura flavalba]
MIAVVALVGSGLAVGGWGVGAAAAAPVRAGGTVIVGVPGLMWSDVTSEATPALWRLAGTGAAGGMSVRTTRPGTCPTDGWLTVSAGQRSRLEPGDCLLPSAPQAVPGGGAVAAGWGAIKGDNAGTIYRSRVGLLGDAARAGGVRTLAVGAGAVYGLADSAGRVDRYVETPDRVTPDEWARHRLAAVEIDDLFRAYQAAGVDSEGEQVPVESDVRAEAVRAADRRLATVLAAVPPGTNVLVAGVSDIGVPPHLRLALAATTSGGPQAFPSGYLTSSATRQNGMVTLTDLTTTALDLLGLARPAGAVGSVWESEPTRDGAAAKAAALTDQDVAAQGIRGVQGSFFRVLAGTQIVFFGVAWLLLRRTRHPAGRTRRDTSSSPLGGAGGGDEDGDAAGAVPPDASPGPDAATEARHPAEPRDTHGATSSTRAVVTSRLDPENTPTRDGETTPPHEGAPSVRGEGRTSDVEGTAEPRTDAPVNDGAERDGATHDTPAREGTASVSEDAATLAREDVTTGDEGTAAQQSAAERRPDARGREGSVKDGAVHEGAAHSGAAHEGSAHSGAAHEGSAHSGAAHEGSAHSGAAHEGSAHEGSVRNGAVHGGAVPSGSARGGSVFGGAGSGGMPGGAPVRGGVVRPVLRRRVLGVARVVALMGGAAPVASFLAGLVPWWQAARPTPVLVATVLAFSAALAGVALAGPWRRTVLGPGLVIAAVTVVVLALDVMTGSGLQMNSLMGYTALVAGRFYGFGNQAFSLFAVAAVLTAAWLAERPLRAGRRWTAVSIIAGVGVVTTAVDGLPMWGSDFGGVLAMVPVFAMLALMVTGRRVSVPWLGLFGAVAVAVVLAISWLNSRSANPTHLGRFWDDLVSGNAGEVVARKFGAMTRSLSFWPVTVLLLVGLVFLYFVLADPARWKARVLVRAYEHNITMRPALTAALTVGIIGTLVNDSGVIILSVAFILAAPLTLAAALRSMELAPPQTPTPEPTRHHPAPTP